MILKCHFFLYHTHARTHTSFPLVCRRVASILAARNCGRSSGPWAPCWARTSRRPRGWSCSASRPTCCRRAASRRTRWTAPESQDGDVTKGQRRGNNLHVLFLFDSPECRWWRRCRGPPGSRGSAPPGSSGRTAGKWEGRSRSRPAHKHHHSYILQSSMGNVSKCTTRPTEDAPAQAGQEVSKEKLLLGFNGRFSFGCTELKGRVNN